MDLVGARRVRPAPDRAQDRGELSALLYVGPRDAAYRWAERRNLERHPVTGGAQLVEPASAAVPGHRFSPYFLRTEWVYVVDAWQLATWEEYRGVRRLGRKTRLAESQRAVLWSIF